MLPENPYYLEPRYPCYSSYSTCWPFLTLYMQLTSWLFGNANEERGRNCIGSLRKNMEQKCWFASLTSFRRLSSLNQYGTVYFFQCLTCEGCCLLTCGQIPLAGAMGSKKWWLAMGLKCALFCMACSC